jgi:tetratricopeptide (TPR) repeat protein
MYLPNKMPSIQLKNRKKFRPDDAVRALTLLLWLVNLPALGQDRYLLGMARLQEGDYEAARIRFEQVLAGDANDPEALSGMAETCYQADDYNGAIGYFERLEAIREGMGSYGLARCYARQGDAPTAMQYLEKHLRSAYKLPSSTIFLDEAFVALEHSPEWKSLWKHDWYSEEEEMFQEIAYLIRSGDHLDALDLIDKALKEAADLAPLLTARGKVFYAMGQYQQSIHAYTAAIELTRMDPESFYGRAQSYMALGKDSHAIPDLKRTLQLDPEKLEILKELCQASLAAGNFKQATDAIEEYQLYYPGQAEAMYLHGQTLYQSGQYLKALSSFNRCLEQASDDPRYYLARGKTYLATSTYRYAINDFGMSLDLDPKNHEAWFLKGMARWYAHDREGSISDWEVAARYGSEKAAKRLEELDIRR